LTTFEEIKAKSKLATKSVPLCLAGDLQAEFEELQRQQQIHREAQKRGGTLSGSSAELRELDDKIALIRAEMQEATQVFTLRAMPAKRYSDLKASHGPRKDHDDDQRLGYNGDTFTVALIQACLIDPALTIPEVEELCDLLTQGQWDKLFVDALYLNALPVDIPT
jgi:hypothetical protein